VDGWGFDEPLGEEPPGSGARGSMRSAGDADVGKWAPRPWGGVPPGQRSAGDR